MFDLKLQDDSFSVGIFSHRPGFPMFSAGVGDPDISMYRGNFFFRDSVSGRFDFDLFSVTEQGEESLSVVFSSTNSPHKLPVTFSSKDGLLEVHFTMPEGLNRLWLNVPSTKRECFYGCGEQFSYFNLKGKSFPIWTEEQGVGRNKRTRITQEQDRTDKAGGDYYTTFYPQTNYISSRNYFLAAETFNYSVFDFSPVSRVSLEFWDKAPARVVVGCGSDMIDTLKKQNAYLGHQKELPDWVYDGVILALQDGTESCLSKYRAAKKNGIEVCGIWAQDWSGENVTSFGKRVRWNWQWDPSYYPGLDVAIKELGREGVHFLAYANPYLAKGFNLFEEAEEKGLLCKNKDGGTYLLDAGEFDVGIPDFTNPDAVKWFAERIIKTNMLDFGIDGWMADFGEYLPTDVVLFDGSDPMEAHNRWPGLWAKLNHDAIEGARDRVFFFMRAGNAMSPRYCSSVWAGDQNVDWSQDDGLPSALRGALSLAMSGYGLHFSDLGGYTTVCWLKRTKELLLRWAEFSAFTPIMRTHEGNRPASNWQFYTDNATMKALAPLTRVHKALKPYLKELVKENSETGIPVMRPLLLDFGGEAWTARCDDEYMLGPDLLVAPVMKKGAVSRKVRLPEGEWTHLFTGKAYNGGIHEVKAPIGLPPVFVRKGAAHDFKEVAEALKK